jgi:RNA polymerase subunit RPABC4/transcription elongation factor Spt4
VDKDEKKQQNACRSCKKTIEQGLIYCPKCQKKMVESKWAKKIVL